MNRIFSLLLATAVTLPGAAFATSDLSPGDAAQARIRTLLEADGYEVRNIQIEDGLYEAYATRNGDRFEIYLDGDFRILRAVRD